ncbi:hypothetical protein D1007_37434 [Hordeum vulgare]|nr:hypothetical protein D1007_37434 [Hordeum vulgare]
MADLAPWIVLLHREIDFCSDEAVCGGEPIAHPWGFWEGIRGPKTRKAMSDEAINYLRTFKARAVVANPPELSFLRILVLPQSLPLPAPFMGLHSGRISSMDKNLVALYAGGYRGPGSTLPGGYLIYEGQ